MPLLDRYILRAHAGPFLFSLATLMFIFLLQFVMKFIDQLVGKGLTAWVIIELVALNLSWMLVLAVPMSVLVATLMAFGELSSRNEITAMKAGGVSIYRMMAPVLFAGILVGLVMVWFNNDVLPESNHRLKALTTDIRRKKPTIALVDGVFSQDIPGYSLLVRNISPAGDLAGVTLYDYSNASKNIVITATHGTITLSPDYRKILLNLREGEIHELDIQDMNAYRRVRFTRHRIAMDVEGFDFERSAASAFARGDRELSAPAMLRITDSLNTVRGTHIDELRDLMTKEIQRTLKGVWDTGSVPPALTGNSASTTALVKSRTVGTMVSTYSFRIETLERQASQYWVEIHKKYSIPTACVVFVLVGLPLGIMARRGGFGIAATLSLGFFVLYWAFLIGGEKLADRDILSPLLGMWAANIIIGIMGLYLTFRTGRESVVIDWSFFQRLVPRRLQGTLPDEHPADTTT